MTGEELLEELKLIFEVHPEAKGRNVWVGIHDDGALDTLPAVSVVYDTRHKVHRIRIEN